MSEVRHTVHTVFKADRGLEEIERKSDRAGQSVEHLGRKTRGLEDRYKSLAKAAATIGMAAFIAAASQGARTATRFAVDYSTALKQVETLVGIAREQTQAWGRDLLALGPATGRGPVELAKALFVVTSAGARGAEALEIVRRAGMAASVGLGETAEVARAVTAAVQAWSKEGLTAAQATDVMVATVRAGNLAASDLAGNLGRLMGIAATMGVSFAQVGGFVATVTRVGVNAEEAVIALRGLLSGFLAGTEQAEKALAFINSSTAQLRRELQEKGLARTLVDLVTAYERIGRSEVIAEAIPNVRALAGALNSAGSQAEAFLEIERDVVDSAGILEEAFTGTTEAIGFTFEQLESRVEALGIAVGDKLAQGIADATKELDFSDVAGQLEELGQAAGQALGDLIRLLVVLLDHVELLRAAVLTLMAIKIATWINAAVVALTSWATASTAAAAATAAVGTTAAAVSPIVDQYGRAIMSTTAATQAATASSSRFLAAGLTPLGAGLAGVLAGVLAVNEAIKAWAANSEREMARIVAAGEKVRLAVAATDEAIRAMDVERLSERSEELYAAWSAADDEVRKYRASLQQLRADLAAVRAESKTVQKEVGTHGASIEVETRGEEIAALEKNIARVERALRQAKAEAASYEHQSLRVAAVHAEAATAAEKAARAMQQAEETADQLARRYALLANQAKLATLEAERHNEAAQDLASTLAGELADAADEVARLLADRAAAGMTEAQRETREWTSAVEELAAAVGPARKAVEDAIAAAEAYAAELSKGTQDVVELARIEADRAAAVAELRSELAALAEGEELLNQARSQSAAVLAAISDAQHQRLAAVARTTEEIVAEAAAMRQGEEALAAHRRQVEAAAAMEQAYQTVLAETGSVIAARNAALARGAAMEERYQAEDEANARTVAAAEVTWERVGETMRNETIRMVASGELSFRGLFDSFKRLAMDAIESFVRKWQTTELGSKTVNVQSSGTGAGAGAGAGQSGQGAGVGAMGALGTVGVVVGIFALVYGLVKKKIESDRLKLYSTPITVGFDQSRGAGTGWRSTAVGGAGLESSDALKITARLRQMFDELRQAIGGFLDFVPEFGIQVQASGKKFKALVAGVLIGVFSSAEDAMAAALADALAQAEFSGIGRNVEQALRSAVGEIDLDQVLADVELARQLDQLDLHPTEIAMADLASRFTLLRERAQEAGLSLVDLYKWRNKEILAIRETIEKGLKGLIPGAGSAVEQLLALKEQSEAFARGLEAEAAARERELERINKYTTAPPTPGGGAVVGSEIGDRTQGGVIAMMGAVDASAQSAAQGLGVLHSGLVKAGEGMTEMGAVGDRVATTLGRRWHGIEEDAADVAAALADIPAAVDPDLIAKASEAVSLGIEKSLGDWILQYEHNSVVRGRVLRAEFELEMMQRRAEMESLRLLGRLTDAQLATYQQALDRIEAAGPGEAGLGGGGGDRRRYREEFRRDSQLVELALAGMSDAALQTRSELAALAEAMDEARGKGIGAAEATARYANELALMVGEVMGDVRERLRQHGETDFDTGIRGLEEERAARLGQLELIARQQAEVLGVAFEEAFAPLAAEVGELFDLDRLAALREELGRLAGEGDEAGIAALAERFAELPGAAAAAAEALAQVTARLDEQRAAARATMREEVAGYERQLGDDLILQVLDLQDAAAGWRQVVAENVLIESERAAELGRINAVVAGHMGRIADDALRGWSQMGVEIAGFAAWELEVERGKHLARLAMLATEEAFLARLAALGTTVEELGRQLNQYFDDAIRELDRPRPTPRRPPAAPPAVDLTARRKEIDELIAALNGIELGPVLSAARDLGEQIAELRRRALAEGTVEQRRRAEEAIAGSLERFRDSAYRELLGGDDVGGLGAEYADLVARINDTGDALRLLGVDMSDFAAVSQQALDRFFDSAKSGLRQLHEELTSGQSPLSTLTTREALGAAEERYWDVQAALAANPQDLAALEQAEAAARQYLERARELYPAGPEYDRIQRQVTAWLAEVLGAEGAAEAGGAASSYPYPTAPAASAESQEAEHRRAQERRELDLLAALERNGQLLDLVVAHLGQHRNEDAQRHAAEGPTRQGLALLVEEHLRRS